MNSREITARFDHTLLKAEATPEQIRQLCREAQEMQTAAVCVNPWLTALAARELADSDIKICTVVGFPLGTSASPIKAAEAAWAVADGAREIDMVLNIGAFKCGNYDLVERDISEVVKAAQHKAAAVTVKVIIETCLLSTEEKITACQLVEKGGADFVKTSTGFNKGGATVADVRLLKQAAGNRLKIKAAGGITDYACVMALLEAGADRLGLSAGYKIFQQLKS